MRPRSLPLAGASIALLLALAIAPTAAAGTNVGAVYTLTNGAAGNAVVAYARGSGGSLSPLGTFPTGGMGSGAGLGSQGALTLSSDNAWLLAVNAGSDEISTFAVGAGHGLTLADVAPSGGDHPISVTISGDVVYVLNDGGAGNIAGFRIDAAGDLHPIAGAVQPLSTAASGPAQIQFNPAGDALVVTEKATNRITVYDVTDGLAAALTWIASAGQTPFGFDFDNKGRAIVTEAFGGAADASTVSSYAIDGTGASILDGPAATTESAACWLVVTNNGKYAYAANTGSGTVSGFRISPDGGLDLLDGDGVTGVTPGPAADAALSVNSKFLYVRSGGTVHALRVANDGSLATFQSTVVGAGIVGLASI